MNQPFIYLASASPRRRELLDQIHVRYRACPVDIDERRHDSETPEEFVCRVAAQKAQAARVSLASDKVPILAADTAVVIDGKTLGKPQSRDKALAMLERLSGREHEVLTAVAALRDGHEHRRLSRSIVRLRALQPGEAEAYWDSGEPADKAGGYAIQGKAAVFVADLRGSYSGVMGLPLFETAELLAECGVTVFPDRKQ